MASSPITSWEINRETVSDFIFWGSKITADGDFSHEIKRCLLFGRETMSNLDSILKKKRQRPYFTNKGPSSQKALVVMYGCENWTIKKAECLRIDALEWTGWISLHSKGLSRVFSNTTVQKCSAFFMVQLSYPYMTTGKTIALTRRTFVDKVMSLLFNTLSRLVITFFPRSKHLLISCLQSPSAVILEPKKIKSLTVSIVSPAICHEVMGLGAMILVF